ncbi:MAG: amidohydrolase family protein, partial [Acidobacteriota bacterium]|nr:amidohydrolase family protein [Acidobacteriota bacterium]
MDLPEVAKLRDEINAGKILAPRLFYAGTVINGEGEKRESNRWTGNSVQVKTADEARAAVESLYRAGADYIKTEKLLPPEILKEVIAAAHKHKMRVVAVPPSFVMDASNDGLDCVEHFVELYRTTSTKRDEYYAFYRDRKTFRSADEAYAFFKPLRDTRDQSYYDQTLQTMARNKTFLVTNFAEQGHSMETRELADSSRRRFKTKKQLEQLDAAIKEKEHQRLNRDFRTDEKAWKGLLQDIADLHKAGVMLLAGTQLNITEPSSPGIMLHDELYWFVQAGLSPFEALKTATINPAIFMRREKDLGTIEKGKLADLVLLDANPLQDISNTRRINAVVANGRLLDRKTLDKMLADVEAAAKQK